MTGENLGVSTADVRYARVRPDAPWYSRNELRIVLPLQRDVFRASVCGKQRLRRELDGGPLRREEEETPAELLDGKQRGPGANWNPLKRRRKDAKLFIPQPGF